MTTQITQGVWKYVIGVFLAVTSLSADVKAQSVTIVPSGPIVCAGTKLDAVVTGLNGPPLLFSLIKLDFTEYLFGDLLTECKFVFVVLGHPS